MTSDFHTIASLPFWLPVQFWNGHTKRKAINFCVDMLLIDIFTKIKTVKWVSNNSYALRLQIKKTGKSPKCHALKKCHHITHLTIDRGQQTFSPFYLSIFHAFESHANDCYLCIVSFHCAQSHNTFENILNSFGWNSRDHGLGLPILGVNGNNFRKYHSFFYFVFNYIQNAWAKCR